MCVGNSLCGREEVLGLRPLTEVGDPTSFWFWSPRPAGTDVFLLTFMAVKLS